MVFGNVISTQGCVIDRAGGGHTEFYEVKGSSLTSTVQANITRLILEYAIKPVKNHQVRQTQIIQLAMSIGTFGSAEFTQSGINATLMKVVVQHLRLAL